MTVQAGGTARAKALRWEHARGMLGPSEASVARGRVSVVLVVDGQGMLMRLEVNKLTFSVSPDC